MMRMSASISVCKRTRGIFQVSLSAASRPVKRHSVSAGKSECSNVTHHRCFPIR